MSLISVQNMTIHYENASDPVFEHLDLHLDSSWKLGLIGPNGSGKSTLLQALAGKLPYTGRILCDEVFVRFPMPVPEEGLPAWMAVAQAYGLEESWKVCRELDLMGMEEGLWSACYSDLSEGEKICFQMCALFASAGTCMLLDEPTNHLDAAARSRVCAYLQGKDHFIVASHDRQLLDACCDHILSLSSSKPELVQGHFADWYAHRQAHMANQKSEQIRLRKEVASLERSAREKKVWSHATEASKQGNRFAKGKPADQGFISHKAAKMAKRAKGLEKRKEEALQQRKALLKNIEEVESLKMSPLPFYTKQLLYVQDVQMSYTNPVQDPLCQPVSFTLEAGDRVLLAGRNGAGKSSLLELVMQKLSEKGKGTEAARGVSKEQQENCEDRENEHMAVRTPLYIGQIEPASQLQVSYVPQTTQEVTGTLDAFALGKGADPVLFRSILRKLGFDRAQFEVPLQACSDGQKRKIQLAASLAVPAHLYIWDEPLNYLDLEACMQVETLLMQTRVSLLMTEHDAVFANKVATQIVTLHRPLADQRQ